MSDLPTSSSHDTDSGRSNAGYNPGQKVGEGGRFELDRQLGRGGMGVVWLAKDTRLKDRLTALKFLPPEVRYAPAALADLREETLKARDLTHDHIVRIHDLHESPGETFISMEYVDGPTLSHVRLENGGRTLSWERLAPIVAELCDALEYAHTRRKPLIHRDLKPGNIMLDSEGKLKLADFGFARTISDSLSLSMSNNSVSTMGTSGTPAYMSPQQLQGKSARPTDDIYSLGAMMYEMLTGKPPFYTGDISYQVRSETPDTLAQRLHDFDLTNEIPDKVEAVVAACLAKDAAARPQSARQVAEMLGLRAPLPSSATAATEPIPAASVSFASAAPATDSPPTGAASQHAPPVAASTPRSGIPRGTVMALSAVAAGAVLVLGSVCYFTLTRQDPASVALVQQMEANRQQKGVRFIPAAMGGADVSQKEDAAELERQRVAKVRTDLVVETTPAGATVTIDGMQPLTTPATFKGMKLGEYEVRISRDGYESIVRKVVLKENETARLDSLRMANLTGTVKLTSPVPDATYELKGVDGYTKSGPLPVELSDVPVGDVSLSFSAPGLAMQGRSMRVENGKETAMAAPFALPANAISSGGNAASGAGAPTTGVVTITTVPAGVTVMADGKSLGVTPLTLKDQAPGNYTWEFTKPGFQNATKTAQVVAGQTTDVSVTVPAVAQQQPQQQREPSSPKKTASSSGKTQSTTTARNTEKQQQQQQQPNRDRGESTTNRTINTIVDKLKYVPIPRIRF